MRAASPPRGITDKAVRNVRDDLRVLQRAICELRIAIDASREIIDESLKLVRHPVFEQRSSVLDPISGLSTQTMSGEGQERRAGAGY